MKRIALYVMAGLFVTSVNAQINPYQVSAELDQARAAGNTARAQELQAQLNAYAYWN